MMSYLVVGVTEVAMKDGVFVFREAGARIHVDTWVLAASHGAARAVWLLLLLLLLILMGVVVIKLLLLMPHLLD